MFKIFLYKLIGVLFSQAFQERLTFTVCVWILFDHGLIFSSAFLLEEHLPHWTGCITDSSLGEGANSAGRRKNLFDFYLYFVDLTWCLLTSFGLKFGFNSCILLLCCISFAHLLVPSVCKYGPGCIF